MDFVRAHSSDEEWILAHEQYRPFVLFHRTQAAALAELEENGPEGAVEEIHRGLDAVKDVFVEYGAEEHFDDDELVTRLRELRDSIREHFGIGRTLREQLDDAVAAEEYELAAKLRDELAKKKPDA
jgi:FAD/FMN-containing dehydrogenase